MVVVAFTGEVAFTLRASLRRKWLRLRPVFRGLVCFFGCPIQHLLLRLVIFLETIIQNFDKSLKAISINLLSCLPLGKLDNNIYNTPWNVYDFLWLISR